MKVNLKSELLLYPCPVLLVTSKYKDIENVFTVSWSGIASSHPEYITISIKPSRFSHSIIKQSSLFTANIIDRNLLFAADYCGKYSGKNKNKFKECNLTRVSGEKIDVPYIVECPINIECKVEDIICLGSHDLFIGKVMNKLISEELNNANIHKKLDPVSYFRPFYYSLNKEPLGYYGGINQQFEK